MRKAKMVGYEGKEEWISNFESINPCNLSDLDRGDYENGFVEGRERYKAGKTTAGMKHRSSEFQKGLKAGYLWQKRRG